jgi:hypothetical protein
MPGDTGLALDTSLYFWGFNPRPALMPGDTKLGTDYRQTTKKFQSAPGTNAGRYRQRRKSLFGWRNLIVIREHSIGTKYFRKDLSKGNKKNKETQRVT